MERRGWIGIAALAIFAASATASATTVDFGTIAPGDSVSSSFYYAGTGVAVDDTWMFTLTSGATLAAVVVNAADLDPSFVLSDFVVSDASGNLLFDYDDSDNSYGFTGVLGPGTYQFNVTGVTSGLLGGGYDVIVGGTAATVPLPATLWLMIAALGVLPAMLRRQSS